MEGDGICQPVCNTEDCDYDFGDCDECNSGCEYSEIIDDVCQEECFVEACYHDSGSCGLCYPDKCLPEWRNNSVCEPECYAMKDACI